MGVVAAGCSRLVSILSLGCDSGPSVVSGGRRFQVIGGRAVVVGTGGCFLPRGGQGSQPPDAFVDEVDPGGFGREVELNLSAGPCDRRREGEQP